MNSLLIAIIILMGITLFFCGVNLRMDRQMEMGYGNLVLNANLCLDKRAGIK